jgi:hypothetical protein
MAVTEAIEKVSTLEGIKDGIWQADISTRNW